MRFARSNLGLIPEWQFNMDPAVNPKLATVNMPDGVYQTTVQPLSPYYYQGPQLGYRRVVYNPSKRKWMVIGGLALAGLAGLGAAFFR
jgi:hypothetical protein